VAVLEQLKGVFAPMTKVGGQDFGGPQIGNQLLFLSVALLFATVVPALAFWGRSIGCSVASITSISSAVQYINVSSN
jgi:hypothetical protein